VEKSKGGRPESEMKELHEQWEKLMCQPEFNELSHKEQAQRIGVSDRTLDKWHLEAPQSFWDNVASTIRSQYSQYAPKVDMSVIKAAQNGSYQHQELFYKRFEGWSPKQTNENINRNPELEGLSDTELMEKALKDVPRDVLLKVLNEKKAPEQVVEPGESQVNG
jgi:hypothetical protein